MHAILIGLSLGLAIALRHQWRREPDAMPHWGAALSAFLIPPILSLLTAVAVINMGIHGRMFALPVGQVGYGLGLGYLGFALGLLGWQGWQGWRSRQSIRRLESIDLGHSSGRLLSTPQLFAGQVGFWSPELVLSQGLLAELDPEQINAVLSHEQAHCHYRDTFWYFWMGWLRQLTGWLPNTDVLWQELLLLRELRADRWAAQRVDPLLLAETLLYVTQSYQDSASETVLNGCVALSDTVSRSRLDLRIDQLLTDPAVIPPVPNQECFRLKWLWLLVPIVLLAFHT